MNKEYLQEHIRVLEEERVDLIKQIKILKEKQTPMIIELEAEGYSTGDLVFDTAICPNCGRDFEIENEHYIYCPSCGQKLDWSKHSNKTYERKQ